MRRFVYCLAILFFSPCGIMKAFAQDLLVQAFVPEGTLIQKEQLWNLVITNPTATPQSGLVSLTIVNKSNSQKIMTAVTNSISIQGGAKLYQVSDLMPVFYNALSSEINLNESGFLPVGEYQFCYEFVGTKGNRSGISCVDARVEWVTPPQLIAPGNMSMLDSNTHMFSWVPPSPSQLMGNCTYSFRIVSILPNQDAANAIKDNTPFYEVSGLTSSFHSYPRSAPELEVDKHFAWQVTANTASSKSESEVWEFTTNKNAAKQLGSDGSAYTKLERAGNGVSYSVVSQYLQFSFTNDGVDSLFVLKIYDVSLGRRNEVKIARDAIPKFLQGVSIVRMDLPSIGEFEKGHMYELVLTDRLRQEWKMMFQYGNVRK